VFKAAFSDTLAKARKKLEREWRDTRQEMFTALSEYPPDVSEHTFLTRFDDRFGHPTGRTKGFTEPTPTITDETQNGYLPNSRRNSSNSQIGLSTRISSQRGNLKTHAGFPL